MLREVTVAFLPLPKPKLNAKDGADTISAKVCITVVTRIPIARNAAINGTGLANSGGVIELRLAKRPIPMIPLKAMNYDILLNLLS